jgi:hypothetical protein
VLELSMRKTQFTMIINNHTQIIDTRFHVVHPNVGLRPPSIGIGCLIIQIMEITSAHSHSVSHSRLCLYGLTCIYIHLQETE